MPPTTAEQTLQIAMGHHQAGRTQEAEALYRQILQHEPARADVWHTLGILAYQTRRPEEAVEWIRRAITLQPGVAAMHNNLGVVLKDIGRMDESTAACRQAIALKPDFSEAYYNLGNALHGNRRLDEAIEAYRNAIARRPNYPDALYNMGNVFVEKEAFDEAAAAFERAIALQPRYAEAYSNLGNMRMKRGRADEAVAAFRQAIVLKPDFPEAHCSLAVPLLARGDLVEGWREYEWRWKCKDFTAPRRPFPQPLWDGAPLNGRAILLHAEQGFGDTMQYIRYAPLVAQRGGRVMIECQPALLRLLQQSFPEFLVVAAGAALPTFDVHCPLASLPRVFGTTIDSVPRNVPYLRADENHIRDWRQRLQEHFREFNVGLVWGGRDKPDPNRSCRLRQLAPLAQVAGAAFFSLQTGEAAAEILQAPAGLQVIDAADGLTDFADTAARMTNMDLVLTIDTAAAHLAGAMGKTVWTLLPFNADWRWLMARADSPWYPTMRLFRQTAAGDWETVIEAVAQALTLWKKDHASSGGMCP